LDRFPSNKKRFEISDKMENRSDVILGQILVDCNSKVRDAPMPDLMKNTEDKTTNPEQNKIDMVKEIFQHFGESQLPPSSSNKVEVTLFQGSTRIYTSEERNQRNPSLLLRRCNYSRCYMGQHWRDIPTARINHDNFKTAFNKNGTYCICGNPLQYGFISDSGEEKWVGHGTARKYLKNL
jgi:hypothetical protein